MDDEAFRREAVRRLRELARIPELESITLVHKQVGDGWLSLEPFHFHPDAESNVPVSLRHLRSILDACGE